MMILMLVGMVLCFWAGLYWMAGRWLALYGIDGKKLSIRVLRGLAGVLAVGACFRWNTAALVELHLLVLFAITELAARLLRQAARRYSGGKWYRKLRRIYHSGLVPVVLLCMMMGYGYWNMGSIRATEYTISSEKLACDYEVVFLSDIHYGTIQRPEALCRAVEEINARHPDLVILGGDIVEDGTSKEAMEEAFRVLGKLKSTFGTYYIYGNHDRQRYRAVSSRAYTEEDLEQAIQGNGIAILWDRTVIIGGDLALTGREDAGETGGRLPTGDLLRGVDRDRFLIVADHRPVGVEENASEGVDLQLSGHTHAGQIFPGGYLIDLFGGMHYGLYREGECRVIVSSGVAGWGFPIRTQGKCEYVVVQLRKGAS